MWFNHSSNFLLKRGYTNNDDCPCVFIEKSLKGFCIILVYVTYVNDLNIIGTTEDIEEAMTSLKKGFEVKDLGKTPIVVPSMKAYMDPFRHNGDDEEVLGPEAPT